MPKRKYAPRRNQRYRRRRKRRSNTLHIGRSIMPGFPSSKSVKMRYVDSIQLNPGAASVANYQFRANSIFDPDLTGTGHQPLGHDEWQLFYNHYVVTSAKITVQVMATTSNSSSMNSYGIYLSDDATVPSTTPEELMEQGKGTYWVQMDHVNSGISTKRHSLVYGARSFFNLTDVKDNVDRIGAAFGANPTELAFFNVWGADLAGGDPGVSQVLVTIEYNVAFSEPKSLNQS